MLNVETFQKYRPCNKKLSISNSKLHIFLFPSTNATQNNLKMKVNKVHSLCTTLVVCYWWSKTPRVNICQLMSVNHYWCHLMSVIHYWCHHVSHSLLIVLVSANVSQSLPIVRHSPTVRNIDLHCFHESLALHHRLHFVSSHICR